MQTVFPWFYLHVNSFPCTVLFYPTFPLGHSLPFQAISLKVPLGYLGVSDASPFVYLQRSLFRFHSRMIVLLKIQFGDFVPLSCLVDGLHLCQVSLCVHCWRVQQFHYKMSKHGFLFNPDYIVYLWLHALYQV